MTRLYGIWITFLMLPFLAQANNVKVDTLTWDPASVTGNQDTLKMQVKISWENSWRDDYNYDAVYLFFKFKLKDAGATAEEQWFPVYLSDKGHKAVGTGGEQYDYWVSPLSKEGANYNTGIYVYRKNKGAGKSTATLTVCWNIKTQLDKQLTSFNFVNNNVLITAHALEMVYVPRGIFRLGDGFSNKCFRKSLFPIPEAYDLVSDERSLSSSAGNPQKAADHLNDNSTVENSVWKGSDKEDSWWMIDFGAGQTKKMTYFGVNAYGASAPQNTYVPATFRLEGGDDPRGNNWTLLWEGPGAGNWIFAPDAYPVEKALKIPADKQKAYRCYRLYVPRMATGMPMVTSIGMTDRNLEELVDYTVVVDDIVTKKDTLRGLGARDGFEWKGDIPASFPNGYRGFYAMKYEISQEQYVRFLNKLSFQQQNSVLDGRLDAMREGDYVFGDAGSVNYRNGIVLNTKISGRPAVFANNLNPSNEAAASNDGQSVACNYMNIADMLAYADWAGLRPLTEMEYEKMARRPYPALPEKGEFAWNSREISKALDLGTTAGTVQERATSGNANYGGGASPGGPIRVGSFARGDSRRTTSGAGFSGAMELSGNLAEMYYSANYTDGLNVVTPSFSGNTHVTAHGDGKLDANGRYDGFRGASVYWKEGIQYVALRGGNFQSEPGLLAVSDRTFNTNALSSVYRRDSTVTFRLGRSVPDRTELISVLTLESDSTTVKKDMEDMLDNDKNAYTIKGNKPEGINGAYSYIWYKREDGGNWRIIEGENNRDLIFRGYLRDTRISQYYYFKRLVVSGDADSRTSSGKMAVLSRKHIVFNGAYRCWADGSYARSANEYRNPAAPYKYEGSVGSGVYRIDPDGPNGAMEPFDVYCDMETDGGGWMLAGKFSNHDARSWCMSKEIWMNDSVFGDATDEFSFADAKSKVWAASKISNMMFRTTRVAGKAFRTNTNINNTLAAYFTVALRALPNKNINSIGCYQELPIVFLGGAVKDDFLWINDKAADGFKSNKISIGKWDRDDTMGIISGGSCAGYDADFGLGVFESAVFGGIDCSDVGTNGVSEALEYNNVMLFVK